MTKSDYRNLIKQDERAYGELTIIEKVVHPGLKISRAYRRFKYYSSHRLMKPLGFIFRIQYHRLSVKYGFDVPSSVSFEGGLRIFHPNGIVINSGTRIGKNFTISGG